jgi:hypothetical protein
MRSNIRPSDRGWTDFPGIRLNPAPRLAFSGFLLRALRMYLQSTEQPMGENAAGAAAPHI